MALIKCKECGAEISSRAESCPKCGRKNPNYISSDTIAKGLAGVTIIAFLAYACSGSPRNESDGTQRPVPATETAALHADNASKELINGIVASIKLQNNWEKIEILAYKAGDYRLALWYKAEPQSLRQAQDDTTAIVREILKGLLKNGQQPAKDMTSIFVHARKRIAGETQGMVASYGKAVYDYNSDSIEFKPAK